MQRLRRKQNAFDAVTPWFRFRAHDMGVANGAPVSSIPDMAGGAVTLSAGGVPPIMIGVAMPNGQRAVFFDPVTGVNRLDFNQQFTATSGTMMVVVKATNVALGDQGLVVCTNLALYGVLTAFGNRWGCYVKSPAESGYNINSVFKVVTLRVNADTSFDMFDMGNKVSFAAQGGSFPGRSGSSVGGDPGGSQQFKGFIAELHMFTTVIPDAAITAKAAELQAFYGF